MATGLLEVILKMDADTNFEGKYIVVKRERKNEVYIDYGKILSNPVMYIQDRYCVEVEVIQATNGFDEDNLFVPFDKGDIYCMCLSELVKSYDIVDTNMEIVTKLL